MRPVNPRRLILRLLESSFVVAASPALRTSALSPSQHNCDWASNAHPPVYDCRGKVEPIWDSVCGKAVAHYAHAQPAVHSLTYACNGLGPNASLLFERMQGRTLVVMGESHHHNLFCALSCWLRLDAGKGAAFGQNRLPGPDGTKTFVMRLERPAINPTGQRAAVRFMLPACAAIASKSCDGELQSSLTVGGTRDRHPLKSTQSFLHRLVSTTRGDSDEWKFVLLFSLGASHYRAPWFDAADKAKTATWMGHAVPLAGREETFLCKRTGCYAQTGSAYQGAITHYARALQQVLPMLKELNTRNQSLVLVVEASPEHFPSLNSSLMQDRRMQRFLDDPGAFDKWMFSQLAWGAPLLKANLSGSLNAIRVLAAAQLVWPHWPTGSLKELPWDGWTKWGRAHIPTTVNRIEMSCADQPSPISCLEHHLQQAALSNGTLRRFFTTAAPFECVPHPPHDTGVLGWRAKAERLAINGSGLQLLERYVALAPRFDLHPGFGHPSRPPELWPAGLAHLDCNHFSFAPGAWDVEVQALLSALNTRFVV